MRQYQVRSTFISTIGLLVICILMLVNALASLFLNSLFQVGWFSILLSCILLIFLVGILLETRKVKLVKVSNGKVIFGGDVLTPHDLSKITITHNQIKLTRAERINYRKTLLFHTVNSEEMKSLTEELLDFAKEHDIAIVNQI